MNMQTNNGNRQRANATHMFTARQTRDALGRYTRVFRDPRITLSPAERVGDLEVDLENATHSLNAVQRDLDDGRLEPGTREHDAALEEVEDYTEQVTLINDLLAAARAEQAAG